MTTMIAEVYDALLDAGASQDKARKAAEAIAGYENRFAEIEKRLQKLEGKITLLSWMVGMAITIQVGNLFLSFQILARLQHP